MDVEMCGLGTCILLYRIVTDMLSRNVTENMSTCILTLYLSIHTRTMIWLSEGIYINI